MKNIRIILSPEAEDVYVHLTQRAPFSKIERTLLKAIKNKKELLKLNPHHGDPVAKNLIPEGYSLKYGIRNLFRIELPSFWRMLYTLTRGESETEAIAFVLDIIDHEAYNKKFGYKKR